MPKPKAVTKVLLCTGKLYYELLEEQQQTPAARCGYYPDRAIASVPAYAIRSRIKQIQKS